MNCERCGSPGAVTALITWEDPPAERTLCSICADVLCEQYMEAHPPPAEVHCIGCDTVYPRADMKTFANKHGGSFLCPRCYERAESTGRLPWESAPTEEAN